MNKESIWSFIKKNSKELEKVIDIKFNEIHWGDRYYNETGEECRFELLGNQYNVGYIYTTEDDDNWGQAECYKSDWCRKNDQHSNPDELYEILINLKSELRDSKIQELLK